MKSMHRQFGRLMRNDSGDTADFAVLINQFEEADKMLTKIIEACKAWRDSWVSMLSVQLGIIRILDELYKPISGVSNGHNNQSAILPLQKLERISKLHTIYIELKNGLSDDFKMIEHRIIKPAVDAKEFIQPVKKIIKKRENKRLDLEMYTNRVDSHTKKMKRTDRENSAFSRAEEEMNQAASMLKSSDEQLRDILPSIISATYSILPHLLGAQIMIQTSILANYYTALHNYCVDISFPSPPPPMEDVVATWRSEFTPVQQKVELINCITRAKIPHCNMAFVAKSSDVSSDKIQDASNFKQSSSNASASSQKTMTTLEHQPRHIPSNQSLNRALISSTRPREHSANFHDPTCTSSERCPQITSNSTSRSQSPATIRSVSGKKRPPPPPPKRIGSLKTEIYATAVYSFVGQNPRDLSFEEGDVIKVIKKTDNVDDWWEGELRGRQGSFPANYCKIS